MKRRGGYNGLHQWNFTEENGHAVIWNPSRRICLEEELSSDLRVYAKRDGGVPRDGQDWVDNWIRIF